MAHAVLSPVQGIFKSREKERLKVPFAVELTIQQAIHLRDGGEMTYVMWKRGMIFSSCAGALPAPMSRLRGALVVDRRRRGGGVAGDETGQTRTTLSRDGKATWDDARVQFQCKVKVFDRDEVGPKKVLFILAQARRGSF
jgi:hypothetical protein